MLTSEQIRKIRAEARPFIQRQMEDAKVIAGFRDVVTTAGGDWGALKAVIKAEIQDEDDDSGEGKKIGKVVGKAEWTRIYADMLGLSNMNEKNSFAEGVDSIDPQLLAMLVEGSQTEVGRTIIFAALKAVQDGEKDFQPDTGEVHDHPRHGAGGAEDEAAVATVAAAEGAPVEPVETKAGDGNGLRLKGNATANIDSAAGIPSIGPRESGSLAVGAITQREDDASPLPSPTIPHPVEGTTPTSTADGDRGGQVPPPSQPAPVVPSTYPEPGVVVVERCPPEGIVVHPFAACWPVSSIDVTDGVSKPVVKLGKFILDGRGRYFAARDAGIEYPVVQYDGADPLGDTIRWNLASRNPSEKQRKVIAEKLAKIEPGRADEVMQLFGLQLEAAE